MFRLVPDRGWNGLANRHRIDTLSTFNMLGQRCHKINQYDISSKCAGYFRQRTIRIIWPLRTSSNQYTGQIHGAHVLKCYKPKADLVAHRRVHVHESVGTNAVAQSACTNCSRPFPMKIGLSQHCRHAHPTQHNPDKLRRTALFAKLKQYLPGRSAINIKTKLRVLNWQAQLDKSSSGGPDKTIGHSKWDDNCMQSCRTMTIYLKAKWNRGTPKLNRKSVMLKHYSVDPYKDQILEQSLTHHCITKTTTTGRSGGPVNLYSVHYTERTRSRRMRSNALSENRTTLKPKKLTPLKRGK
ncbi:hypothetical protein CLF_105917 [Clonorchis sinensis]|uniref:C2H2-type domain-containing protein n=1 Tax=Clonorchis sinensis TaxID=79923 RepID=G7YEE4_CLOSI|nr:hypothetical protein CLF_105917 [Clonorchis sinensis]